VAADIRGARPEDRATVLAAHRAGFGRDGEAVLCAHLIDEGALALSLVALVDGTIVSHVALSAVALPDTPDPCRMLGLGPIAVLPAHQRRGHGTRLMEAALEHARAAAWDGVVLLGDPDFYRRFGFEPASRLGLRCAWDVPDEDFMAVELRPGALRAARGGVLYHPAFEPD
jgi:putative acetyltransferase